MTTTILLIMKNGLTLVYLTNYINKYLKTKPSDTTRR